MKSNKIIQPLFTALGIGLFVAYVLIVFQPFGTDGFQHRHKNLFLAGYGAIITLSYSLVYLLFDLVLRQRWVLVGRKFWYAEASQLLLVVIISLTGSFFYHHWFVGSSLNWFSYLGFLFLGGSIAIIPIGLIILLRYHFKQRHIQREKDKEKTGEVLIHISGNNKTDKQLKVLPTELLYVMANGNYTEIYKMEDGTIKRYMLRNSLSNIQSQLPEHHFMKVHRSYIVNMSYFEKVYTNSSKYYLSLNIADVEIPLSRNALAEARQICSKQHLHFVPKS